MKRFAIGLLASLALLTPLSPALAGSFQPNAFQLVNFAYEGRYLSEGIPSHLILEEYYTSARIRPDDLISAAIKAGDLPEGKLQDAGYVNAVRLQMRSLQISNHRYS